MQGVPIRIKETWGSRRILFNGSSQTGSGPAIRKKLGALAVFSSIGPSSCGSWNDKFFLVKSPWDLKPNISGHFRQFLSKANNILKDITPNEEEILQILTWASQTKEKESKCSSYAPTSYVAPGPISPTPPKAEDVPPITTPKGRRTKKHKVTHFIVGLTFGRKINLPSSTTLEEETKEIKEETPLIQKKSQIVNPINRDNITRLTKDSSSIETPLIKAKNLDLTPFTELTPPLVITTSTLLTSTSGIKEREITLLSLDLFTKVKRKNVLALGSLKKTQGQCDVGPICHSGAWQWFHKPDNEGCFGHRENRSCLCKSGSVVSLRWTLRDDLWILKGFGEG
ncbi:hypothetical protein ACFE04_002493 [Oxalis oulophora]